MIRVKTSGFNATVKMIDGKAKGVKNMTNSLPYNLARRFKKRVREKIRQKRRPDHNPSGHNTPTPIDSYYDVQKNRLGSYTVKPMGQKGMEQAKRLQKGTRPHPQPNMFGIPWKRLGLPIPWHPGAKGRNFMAQAVNHYLSADHDEIIQKYIRKHLEGKR